MWVALPGHDGTQDLLTRLAHHVRDHVGQLNVHLHQRLLHVLDVPSLHAQQHATLAVQCSQYANLVCRAECPAQQTIAVQLLQPLAVQHIGLATRHVLDVPGVDQQYRQASALQNLVHGDPVHPG